MQPHTQPSSSSIPIAVPRSRSDHPFFADDVFTNAGFTSTPHGNGAQGLLSSSPPSFFTGDNTFSPRSSVRFSKKLSTAEPGSSGWESLINDTRLRTPIVERGRSLLKPPSERGNVDLSVALDAWGDLDAPPPPTKSWWSSFSSKFGEIPPGPYVLIMCIRSDT